jgi:hypothetical protein
VLLRYDAAVLDDDGGMPLGEGVPPAKTGRPIFRAGQSGSFAWVARAWAAEAQVAQGDPDTSVRLTVAGVYPTLI